MMNARPLPSRLSIAALAGTVLAGAAPVSAETTNFLDLSGSVGFASNPGFSTPSKSSAFGRISASGVHSTHSDRGSTSISAYVENTTYFSGGYGSRPLWSLDAHADRAVSPTVTIYGGLGFSGDFAGQLSNRLITVPTEPPVIDPNNPLPPATNNPDFIGLSGRQYRISGQVGASIKTSARDSVSLSAGAQRLIFSGSAVDDYSVFFGSLGYNRQLTERTSVGGSLFLQRQDFKGDSHSTVINPTFDLRTSLRESLTASARVGVMFIDSFDNGDNRHSVSPSFSGSLCGNGEVSSFCVQVARDAQSALGGAFGIRGAQTAISTSASVSYFRRLGRDDTIQASINGTNYSTPDAVAGTKIHSTLISAVGGYDRKIGYRLAAGFSVGARKLFQDGPDPSVDFNGTIYLRYRFGDI